NNTIEQTAGVLESRIEKETEEQRTRNKKINALESRIEKETEEQRTRDKGINALETRLRRETTNEIETRLVKDTTEQVTKALNSRLENRTTVCNTNAIQNQFDAATANEEVNRTEDLLANDRVKNQRPIVLPDYASDRTIHITDNKLVSAIMSKTANVSEMLQIVDETEFQKIQQVLMKVYEKQQLFRLIETEESQAGIVSVLTHRQKNRYSSIIDRYFAGLQSIISSQIQKTDRRETIFEQQRNLLRKVYTESTEQEKEEFAAYLEEAELLYKTADKTVKEVRTSLHNKTINHVTSATGSKLTKETAGLRTSNKIINEIKSRLIRKTLDSINSQRIREITIEIDPILIEKAADAMNPQRIREITNAIEPILIKKAAEQALYERKSASDKAMRITGGVLAAAVINKTAKAFGMLQTIHEAQFQEMRQVFRKEYKKQKFDQLRGSQEAVSERQRDLLRTANTRITEHESVQSALYFAEPILLYQAVKKADRQQNETKIQEIVEHCVKRTTRVTESGTVRKQIDDQKDEIMQLKEKVQQQYEQISEFLRTDNRMPNMDRVYQEIEKRMESRLHLERMRRGL
ncbi:MAG: hypothetical protein K2N95_07550, partial [Lachnospiraceae bacterium]|nr:hypothetical protein [Lachnospiraceae bacterium]